MFIKATPPGRKRKGSSKTDSWEAIRSAQSPLRERGYYRGEIDGRITTATCAALRKFQKDSHLSLTGTLDRTTLQELGIIHIPEN